MKKTTKTPSAPKTSSDRLAVRCAQIRRENDAAALRFLLERYAAERWATWEREIDAL